jgi:hydrogenase maturation protein HypF
VIAIKGLGGFHLVCDARNAAPVARLRSGKRREEKPFAVMVLNALSARGFAELGENETALLESIERPIVLLRKTADCDIALPGVAPGLSQIGLMLPSTPMHYLLFHELLGRPAGTAWLNEATDLALVMTSANPGGEPLVKDDAEAKEHLSGLADAFLTHNRGILHRCDDSVMRWQGGPVFIRRARGFVPRRIGLPFAGPSVLACGPWMKNTVCVTRGDEAFVSQHIGDLDHAGARRVLEETVEHLCAILDVQPQAVAHDWHPDFFSTQFAQRYAARQGIPAIPVQHHHAHIAAVCAEHGVTDAVLGLALDGVGMGSDGEAWGGELLHVEGAHCQRLGHLKPLLMPGGDHAAREPWRMAAAALHSLGRADEILQRFPAQPGASTVAAMLQRGLNCTATSSMGRLFDAAAGLLGVLDKQSYEGQAAMLLEGLAERFGSVAPARHGYEFDEKGAVDFLPLLALLADCSDAAYGAALFHATLVDGLATWATRTTQQHAIDTVALGGGCFLNGVLTRDLVDRLAGQGMRVLTARQVPPNDGGISLGQSWVALNLLTQGIN